MPYRPLSGQNCSDTEIVTVRVDVDGAGEAGGTGGVGAGGVDAGGTDPASNADAADGALMEGGAEPAPMASAAERTPTGGSTGLGAASVVDGSAGVVGSSVAGGSAGVVGSSVAGGTDEFGGSSVTGGTGGAGRISVAVVGAVGEAGTAAEVSGAEVTYGCVVAVSAGGVSRAACSASRATGKKISGMAHQLSTHAGRPVDQGCPQLAAHSSMEYADSITGNRLGKE